MNGTERLLIIILGSAFAVFLLLAIIALVFFIKILRQIRHIAEKAESIADRADAVSSIFQKTAGPMAIGRLIANMAETVFQNKRKRNSKGDDDE